MDNNPIKLLYDATVIANNLNKNAQRSGVYFVACNILKEMLERKDLNISLYCNSNKIFELSKVIKEEFSEYPNLKVINSKKSFFIDEIKYKLKIEKAKAKQEKNTLKKTIIGILLLIVSLIQKPFDLIVAKNPEKELKKIDAFFSPMFKTPDIIRENNIPSYTVLYDTIPLIFPEYFPDVNKGNHWLLDLINSAKSDDHFFSISENTKKDFAKHTQTIKEEQITTTLLAASENFYQCTDSKIVDKVKNKYNIPTDKKYVLSLCTLEPRKNLDFAVKNFISFIEKNKTNDYVLVLAGGHWESFIDQLESKIENIEKHKETIIITGYIDDKDLAPLYSGAEVFVYPSLYEGFGMPPLEAMKCGCPVITSNVSSLPEVVDDAGISINPKLDEELVNAYEKVCLNNNMQKETSERGILKAKDFSWSKTVDKIAAKIQETK